MRVVVVECNNHMMSAHQEPNIPAPGRPKLRPLIPKPFSNIFSTLPTPTPTPTPTSCGYGYRSDNIIINAVPLVSTRWNPTTEQLQALEEMYGQGIRTPSAQQIQQITAKLRGFGKIEGKNVFYWFQNHKARERQRKRRQMEFFAGEKRQSSTGVGRRYLETTNKHPKELPPTPATSEQQGASVHVVQECKEEADNWRHWNCKELQTSEKRCCWPLPLEVLSPCIQENEFAGNRNGNGSFQTLDLFPVKADIQQQQQDMSFCNAYSNKPNHFFEFLPTKNY